MVWACIKNNKEMMMKFRKPLLALVIAASLGGITQSLPALADTRVQP
jgi:hypothetical protein